MSDNLQRYLPEYDDEAERLKLSVFSKEQLLDMLITAYKLNRVMGKGWDEETAKLRRIGEILAEPSKLSQMPGVPSADDLKRMIEDDKHDKQS